MSDPTWLTFYQQQFIFTSGFWLIVKLLFGVYVYDLATGSAFTRPSWLPAFFLHKCHSQKVIKKWVFISAVLSMGFAGYGVKWLGFENDLHSTLLVRISVAILVSLYHLIESSVTHRHGEYTLLYNVWAMCLPSDYASAFSLGIVVHFIFSTALCKIMVGGFEWMKSATMQQYLDLYYSSSRKPNRPFSPKLNRLVREKFASIIATTAIISELLLIPSTLFMPGQYRWIGTAVMVFMHIGIFACMSKLVGMAFFTTLPTYLTGFNCTAVVGTKVWWCALLVAFMPTVLSCSFSKRRLLPEIWPLSAVSLFMWSGHQAKIIAEVLMTGNARIILGTEDKTPSNVVGLTVVHHGAKDNSRPDPGGNSTVVHDCVLRVIGFTLLQNDLLKVSPTITGEWNLDDFLQSLQIFLSKKHRIIETTSGRPLVKALYVMIDNNNKIKKVLKHGGA